MPIIRVRKDKRYFTASNEPFNDTRLSWEARGLIGYLLSKPNGWEVQLDDLMKNGPAGRDKVRRMLAELRICGYINRIRERLPSGAFDWTTEVYESPSLNPHPTSDGFSVTGSTSDALATSGSAISGKGVDVLSTELVNTDSEEEETRAPEKIELSPQLQEALRAAEVYHSVWPEFQARLANDGWTEADIFALIAWVQHKGGNGGRVTARLREGSKAPVRYYSPDPGDDLPPEPAEDPPERAPDWWLDTLRGVEMFDAFSRMLERAYVYDDQETVTIMVPEGYSGIFEHRLTSTLERALVGTIGERSVRFVAAETEPA